MKADTPTRILYSQPLTAPSQPLPENFELFAKESDLSFEFGKRYSVFSEHMVRLSLAWNFLLKRRRFRALAAGRYGETFALLQSLLPGRRPLLLLDIEWYSKHSSWRRPLSMWTHRRIMSGASRVQVFCHAEAVNYAAYFGVDQSKFVWIPYCTGAASLPAPPEPGSYLFTSGTHQRDYATLLKAVADLPIPLYIAAPAAAFTSFDLPPNVKILGSMPAEQYQQVMLGSRLVVVSLDAHVIRRPGVITYVSAMQAGKCVVVNDPAGAGSYIDHGRTGFLPPASNPAALREQIVALWDDLETIETVGLRAQQEANQHFSAGCYYPLIHAALQSAIQAETAS